MFLLGRSKIAEGAERIGLANSVAPARTARAMALEAATQIAAFPIKSVFEAKRLTRKAPVDIEE